MYLLSVACNFWGLYFCFIICHPSGCYPLASSVKGLSKRCLNKVLYNKHAYYYYYYIH